MAELTRKHIDYLSLSVSKMVFLTLDQNMSEGIKTEEIYGLSANEIDSIFHVRIMPDGVPTIDPEVDHVLQVITEAENTYSNGRLINFIDKNNLATFIERAAYYLHNQNTKNQPRLWKMAYAISRKMKLKISPYQLQTIEAAGFNPAVILIFAGVIQQFHDGEDSHSVFFGNNKLIELTMEINVIDRGEHIGLFNSLVHPSEISTWLLYHAPEGSPLHRDGDPYMMQIKNHISMPKGAIPDLLQTQFAGKKLSEVIESPYLVDAIIAEYNGDEDKIILERDETFELMPASEIIAKNGYI